MLNHLSIRDFALIERLDLELDAGMTVISGETGAGKSIMLDALGLALGDRADAGVVRHGADRAEISASFDLETLAAARAWLADRALDADEQCVLRRIVNANGRSRAFINGQAATLQDLRSLGQLLIEIHGQHEHQRLLSKESHLALLDSYAALEEQVAAVAVAYGQWKMMRQKLHAVEQNAHEQSARKQLLSYQVDELDQLAPEEGELARLEQEQGELAHVEELLNAGERARQLVSEGDEVCCTQLLNQAVSQLSELQLENKQLNAVLEMLNEALIQAEEATAELSRYLDRVEIDPVRLAEVEERLSLFYQTARKHRVSPDELPSLHQRLAGELAELNQPEATIEALEIACDEARTRYYALAEPLSDARRQQAQQLEIEVNEQLAQLGMTHALLAVGFDVGKESAQGLEQVELLISTNPGQPPRPLGKIASGGELSRVSLAIQVVTAQRGSTPVLAFDEVDVGIGGATAEVVGRLLRRLGDRCQVLCVTHQPQVAARGHQHLFVSKAHSSCSALSFVDRLDRDARVRELARMLSGVEMTQRSLDHAEEMLAQE